MEWVIIGLAWLGGVLVTLVKQENQRHFIAVTFAGLTFVSSLFLFSSSSDGLGTFLTLIATGIGLLTVIFSVDYMHKEAQLGRYYALVLCFIGAMAGLVLTDSLLALFIFWEITALCSYALISFHNDDPKAVAGGIKALVITQIGGVGLLAGVLCIRGVLGTDSIAFFVNNSPAIETDLLAFTAFGFLLAAAAKSAQVPFHTWLPGAMEAPTPVSALIHAATMVNAGVYLLARFYPAFAGVPNWAMAVSMIGMLSALAGALMALTAGDLKRALAYSTISQLGYMVYAVGIGALFASQFHLLSHAVFKALLFLGAGAVIHATGTRELVKMGGLGVKMPYVRLFFVIGALGLTGVPIFNGFWSKEFLLEAGFAHGEGWMFVAMLLVTMLTALYTLRLVWLVFYGQAKGAIGHLHDAPRAMMIALGTLAAGTAATWVLAQPLNMLLDYPEADALNEVIGSNVTLLTLVITLIGFGLWSLNRYAKWFGLINTIAGADFGFEWINHQIATGVKSFAGVLRQTQTGQLNWNLASVVATLVLILAVIMLGGLL